ncbi:MAG TPA: VOC family protein [Candidatus Saccharimonadales bacterium]|nr:VOC family protein [Candidatus Saccharimonadales bacterium]
MDKISLEPYIFFNGNCREAMEFYKDVFGGELSVNTYGNTPGMDKFNMDWLMHASLEGGAVKLMASDTEKASPEAKKVSLSLGGTDEEYMRKIFDSLSAGGEIFMPLKKESWGDIFGSLTDKFGVEWMMNIGVKEA